jgi:hypothetical protein
MRVGIGNDLIHRVRFFLQGIAETAAKGQGVFRQILTLRKKAEHPVLMLGKHAAPARQALNLLYRKPIISAGTSSKSCRDYTYRQYPNPGLDLLQLTGLLLRLLNQIICGSTGYKRHLLPSAPDVSPFPRCALCPP